MFTFYKKTASEICAASCNPDIVQFPILSGELDIGDFEVLRNVHPNLGPYLSSFPDIVWRKFEKSDLGALVP